MIADHIIRFILDTANAMKQKHGKIEWRSIRARIFKEWHEDYPEKMLEKLYSHEVNNPQWKEKEVKEDYIDLKQTVASMKAEMERKLGDKS